jgi:hypothetical protein
MPSEPFQVEIHIAGGAIVRFKLNEETIRDNPHPWVRARSAAGGRDGLAAGAVRWFEFIFDPKKADDTTHVVDDEGALWIIAGSAVLAVRFFDPTAATPPKRVGFVPSREEPPTT